MSDELKAFFIMRFANWCWDAGLDCFEVDLPNIRGAVIKLFPKLPPVKQKEVTDFLYKNTVWIQQHKADIMKILGLT